jgi:hypothetical protein
MGRGGRDDLPTVNEWGDVPKFANEDEEAEFWATHGLGGAALESLGTFDDDALPPPRPRRRRVSNLTSEYAREVAPQRRMAAPRARASVVVVAEQKWLLAS